MAMLSINRSLFISALILCGLLNLASCAGSKNDTDVTATVATSNVTSSNSTAKEPNTNSTMANKNFTEAPVAMNMTTQSPGTSNLTVTDTKTQGNTTIAMVDPCQNKPCQNDGSCHGNGTTHVCNCTKGWTGLNCTEDSSECSSSPCQNNGTCRNLSSGNFSCSCVPGFTGPLCNIDIDECSPAPCKNNGTCTNLPGNFSCSCAPGFTGHLCDYDINECASSPCKNNGTCQDGTNAYTCKCQAGWNGTQCDLDVDECSLQHQCDAYAECINSQGTYTCQCKHGYNGDGKSCFFNDPCEGGPCIHGNCISQFDNYTCICHPGWMGTNCSMDVDECAFADPVCAMTWGQCRNTNGSYECSCLPGYIGDGVFCTENVMYPYSHDDVGKHADDFVFGPYTVPAGFPYFGQLYHELHVSLDGAIFIGPRPHGLSDWPDSWEFPRGARIVAPFWTDIDTMQGQGALYINVYSHELPLSKGNNSSLVYETVQRLRADIKDVDDLDFNPSYVIVATWENVPPFPANLYANIENITFQCVLVTDSTQSYAMFNFLPDGNHWNPDNDVRRIVIGYSDGDKPTYAAVTNRTYMADKGTNTGKTGRFLYKLGGPVENSNLECLQWHARQSGDITTDITMAEPCPCTLQQATHDTSFVVNDAAKCATSLFPRKNITQYCCYESTSGALLLNHPGGGYPLLPGESLLQNEGRNICCLHSNLCHMFYQKRPSNNCTLYKAPSKGVIYGDPYLHTFDGSQYTFNGLGEYTITNINDGQFIAQGRTTMYNNSAGVFNKTRLSAVAIQGNDTTKLEIRLTPDSDNIQINIEGSTFILLDKLAVKEQLEFQGGVLQKVSENGVLIQFKMKIGIKVQLVSASLWVEVIAAAEFKGADSSVGLLGVFDGRADNDFKMPSGDVIVPAGSESQFLAFGNNWTISKNTSLFTYALDGLNKSWTDFNFPKFTPTIFTDVLMKPDLVNATNFNLTLMKIQCENSTPCLLDYVTTGNMYVALTTKTMQERTTRIQAILESKPPKFTDMPSVIEVQANENNYLTLKVSGVKDAKFSINSSFSQENFSFNGSTLVWMPSISNSTDLNNVYLKVTATNELGLSSLYWPTVKLCACLNGGSCLTDDPSEDTTFVNLPGKSYVYLCQCKTGYSGATCSDIVDTCSQSPCPRGTTCTVTPGVGLGYQCGECSPGYLMRHNKCYDNNECLDGSSMCAQRCENLPGSYSCLCDPGFELQTDKHSCKDINECQTEKCGQNQYCINTIGSHTCRCKASFYLDGGMCRIGPRQFGGQLVFKYVKLPQGVMTGWKAEMADASSDLFYQVTSRVKSLVNTAFSSVDSQNFLDSKIYMLQKGSIIAHFNTYFTLDATSTGEQLGEALQSHLVQAGCTSKGPDCVVGDLIGVNMTWSYATAKDLCLRPEDNDCDPVSTNCTSLGDGTFTCPCKEGFRNWRDLANICQDIDECEEGTHKCNMTSSFCVNHVGTYECRCHPGYHILPENEICTDVCSPNPCFHDGKCIVNLKTNKYTCRCPSEWTGHHCEFEHTETKRLRNAVICLAAILGSLTFIFFVLMIVCWCRAQRAKRQYNTGDVVVDGWSEPTIMIGAAPRNPSLFEMKENGNSKQNLLEQKYGVRGDDDSSLADVDGTQNPAYSTTFQPSKKS